MERKCSTCSVVKPITEFNRDSLECGGYRYYCKACAKVKKQSYLERLKEMNLNQAKFNAIFNGLSAIAKKVYEAVPISAPWDAQQIHHEMIRTFTASDLKTTTGCLNTLVSSGLIREPTKGTFVRIEVKQKVHTPMKKEETVATKLETPMDKLLSISSGLKTLTNTINGLAKELDEVALDIEIKLEADSAETQKLKQLQQILKSLG